MRFSLQDVKKHIQRQQDELIVRLHFLRPGAMHKEIAQLIAYHEQHASHRATHKIFSLDDARACVGDYRMAHCLIATLSNWYNWHAPEWHDTLQHIQGDASLQLAEAGITSPVHLRLALFTFVNHHYSGFLDTQQRTEALHHFAAPYHLSAPDLEYLLALDSEDEEILVRDTSEPPTPQAVATQYNQWVFESALFNASSVHFVIDCNAFEYAQHPGNHTTTTGVGAGVGAVIKRLCYLARLLGVYYDLSYDAEAPTTALRLHLTLYGPQEVTGTAQQYGLRLARLCRLLLGYNIPTQQETTHSKQRQKESHMHLLTGAIVQAEATIHFLQRTYTFRIDQTVLSLLPPVTTITNGTPTQTASDTQQVAVPVPTPMPSTTLSSDGASITPAASSIFDSSIEQTFAEAFLALQQSHAVDGWQLLREPEPLLLQNSIFIPDFALSRDQRRIYVEILGFWTPSYRERKIQKLQHLQDRNDIVLAIPTEAREAFTGRPGETGKLPAHFPVIWYEGQLSATELLHLLHTHYDNFSERLALIDRAGVYSHITNNGLIPERDCYMLLHCYRRSELPIAAERVTDEDVVFASGIGLYSARWIEQLRTSFVEWIGTVGILPLEHVLRESRLRWPILQQCEDATIEAILGLWPELQVHRSSIFEASVTLTPSATTSMEQTEEPEQVKKPARSKGSSGTPKKRVVRETRETLQGDLWG